eukprot:GHVS01052379.1.p1 GENE.GHVS01052379.1~~GHVS01052379.1.p1  ORF type:complete len:428 (+),score=144.66 GHVS01052379.1:54-1286(+)
MASCDGSCRSAHPYAVDPSTDSSSTSASGSVDSFAFPSSSSSSSSFCSSPSATPSAEDMPPPPAGGGVAPPCAQEEGVGDGLPLLLPPSPAADVVISGEVEGGNTTGESIVGEEKKEEEEDSSLFSDFLSAVSQLPVQGPAGVRARIQATGKPETKNSYKLGTADAEVARLTSEQFTVGGAANAFQALLLAPEAQEEEIKRQYKKISLLIHPDKCKNPKAHDAFQVITKAYEELQHPELRERYKQVVDDAKKRVLKRRNKENKLLATKKEPLLCVNESDPDFLQEVAKTCDQMLCEQEERRSYAEKCRAANDRYEKAQEAEAALGELKEREHKRKWVKERDDRVGAWRDFRTQVDEKKMKLQAFTGAVHRKEQRSDNSEAATKVDPMAMGKKNNKKVPMGIDESYKANWR